MILEPKITIGELELIMSKTLHISYDKSCLIQLGPTFEIEFNFINNSDNSLPSTKTEVVGSRLSFNLINYNNSLGTGFIDPLNIGDLNGKYIFLSFYCNTYDFKKGMRTLSVNLYHGKEVKSE